jgi:hypothetical protein
VNPAGWKRQEIARKKPIRRVGGTYPPKPSVSNVQIGAEHTTTRSALARSHSFRVLDKEIMYFQKRPILLVSASQNRKTTQRRHPHRPRIIYIEQVPCSSRNQTHYRHSSLDTCLNLLNLFSTYLSPLLSIKVSPSQVQGITHLLE